MIIIILLDESNKSRGCLSRMELVLRTNFASFDASHRWWKNTEAMRGYAEAVWYCAKDENAIN